MKNCAREAQKEKNKEIVIREVQETSTSTTLELKGMLVKEMELKRKNT